MKYYKNISKELGWDDNDSFDDNTNDKEIRKKPNQIEEKDKEIEEKDKENRGIMEKLNDEEIRRKLSDEQNWK